jgi:hypothetical protein
VYLAYAKPQQGTTRSIAIARARYADGSLHDTKDVFIGEGLGGPTSVAMTPDGKLWIGATEGGKAQDTTWLGGKVLRLNDDGSVPPDNPFVGKEGYRPEIYTLGHRTALGLFVHPLTGETVWFNQADQFHPSTHPAAVYESLMAFYDGREEAMPQTAAFGDGTPMDRALLDEVRRAAGEEMRTFPWQ